MACNEATIKTQVAYCPKRKLVILIRPQESVAGSAQAASSIGKAIKQELLLGKLP
jgi:hypothetical protein